MLQNPIYGNLVAIHDVQYAIRQSCFLQQSGKIHAGPWNLFRWLEHKRIAACNRIGDHPQRHHPRKIERRDSGNDSQRLPNLVHIHAAAGLLRKSTLQQMRNTARELHIFEAPRHLAHPVGHRLAIFKTDNLRQARTILHNQFVKPKHDLRAPRERSTAPLMRCRFGRCDRPIHIFDRRETHLGNHFTRRRIHHRPAASRSRRARLPIDPVRNCCRQCFCCTQNPPHSARYHAPADLLLANTREARLIRELPLRLLDPSHRLLRQPVQRLHSQFQVLFARVFNLIVADPLQRLHKHHRRRNSCSRHFSRIVQRP